MRDLTFTLICVLAVALSACSAKRLPPAKVAGVSLPRIERPLTQTERSKRVDRPRSGPAAGREGGSNSAQVARPTLPSSGPAESHALGTKAADGAIPDTTAFSLPTDPSRTSGSPSPSDPAAAAGSSVRTTRVTPEAGATAGDLAIVAISAATLLALAIVVGRRLWRSPTV